MDFTGVIIGAITFILIGVFHPIVIKGEYYFSKKIWPVFLIAGIVLSALSLYQKNIIISVSLAVTGFTCFWSIHELIEQEERVKKGWFPKNPKRKR